MITSHVEKWDKADPRRLLKINMAIFAFVILAHGPVSILPYVTNIKGFEVAPVLTHFSVPIALSAFIYAIFGLRKSKLVVNALKYHTVLLLIMLAMMLSYSVSILLSGIPSDGIRFSWNPILFGFLFAYPVYLLRLVFLKDIFDKNHVIRYSHVYAVLTSIAISAAVIWKM